MTCRGLPVGRAQFLSKILIQGGQEFPERLQAFLAGLAHLLDENFRMIPLEPMSRPALAMRPIRWVWAGLLRTCHSPIISWVARKSKRPSYF